MAVTRLRRRELVSLIRQNLAAGEDEDTARLCKRLRAARRRGYLTRSELVDACLWKSPRPIRHVRSNSHHRVRAATSAVLGTRDEAARLEALLKLDGVSVPMASAVLMLLDPRRYGVIDIRAWQLLYAVGAVRENEKGASFTVKQWFRFLAILRDLASRLGVTARAVELTLFNVHKARQEGTLYGPLKRERARRS